MKKPAFSAVVLLLTLLLGACAGPPAKPRILWPVPPEQPRLEFIGVYASPNDFPKTAGQKRIDQMIGESADLSFESPMGIAADGHGRVYVSDIHLHNVRVFDFNAKTADFLSKTPIFDSPMGLEVDAEGKVYIADAGKKVVMVFSPTGDYLFTIGEGVLTKPVHLAINRRLGRLYVSNAIEERVAVFNLQGVHLFSFGKGGGGQGEFFGAQGLAIDREGRVFVADQFNSRVQAFDADGNFLLTFGELGDRFYQFESPKDLAFDSDNNLYVIDGRRSYMITYTPTGEVLLTTGTEGRSSHPLGYATPRGIYIDANDRIYVADMTNRRFSVWQYLSEAYLREHPVTEADRELLQQYLKKQAETAQKKSNQAGR
jgi:DNA-binding beta-propeller fold protein YncE